MNIRKNIYSLSKSEFDKFVAAIKKVKASGKYNELIQLHFDSIRSVHGTPMFLPWHRGFLLGIEALLRDAMGDSSFALPYWDWTNDVNSPNQIGKLWGANLMGGTGPNGVTNGPFIASEWVTISPNGQFGSVLTRNLGGTGRPVTTTTDVLRLFKQDQYDAFRTAIENGPHGTMHNWVGGQMASVPNSPNEPVFWLHHANIDRIWAQWQQLYPNVATTAPGMSPNTVMPQTQPGVPASTVGSVLDAPLSRYAYDTYYLADVTWGSDALIPSADNAFGLSSSPALAVYGNKLYCVREGRGDSGWTWCASFDGSNWSGDALIPNADNAYGLSGAPALAVFGGKLYCVRQGRSNSGWTWCASFDGSNWSGDALIPNANNAYGLSSSPALAVYGGKLYCAREGRGDSGWTWCSTFDGNNWSGDALIPNSDNAFGLSGAPALAVFGGKLYCVRQGRSNSGWTWCATFDGNNWSGDALIPNASNAYGLSASPALAAFGGKLYCAREGRGDSGWTWCSTFDGSNWSGDALIPNADNAYGLSGAPALAAFGGKLYCVRQGRGNSGWTWCATASLKIP